VERKSDGFEPFDEVIGQADGRTPPRPKGKRKSIAYEDDEDDDDEDDEEDYDDEYGEMSMEVDSESPANSTFKSRCNNVRSGPVQNIARLRPPATPNGRSSSRPVARSTSVD